MMLFKNKYSHDPIQLVEYLFEYTDRENITININNNEGELLILVSKHTHGYRNMIFLLDCGADIKL